MKRETDMDVMLDIETLGFKPNSVILSIGAITFDPYTATESPLNSFYSEIKVSSCLHHRLIIDPDTLAWWGEQPIKLDFQRLEVEGLPLAISLGKFKDYLGDLRPSGIWAKDPDFDMAALLQAGRQCATPMEGVLPFRQFRSVRTIEAVGLACGIQPYDRSKDLAAHNALNDAINQANMVSWYCRQLRTAL